MSEDQDNYHLEWAHGDLSVRAVGGMIAPVSFKLGDGQRISPLYVAPWAGIADQSLSPLMAGLRGEWPCLPFGPARVPDPLPAGWQARPLESNWDHGYCANHAWDLLESSASLLAIAIDLPANDPVARLERYIRPQADAPSFAVELVIHPRRDAIVPFALHPTFVLPSSGLELVGGGYSAVHAYPMPAEPGVSRLQPNCQAASLKEMPLAGGGTLDVTRLPLPFKTEELMQVENCKPPFVLHYPAQQAEILLDWDTTHLPDALLWFSNGGRAQAPWLGRNYALGIEPTNSCFDLSSVATPAADHPLARRKGLVLQAGLPLRIRYSLSARRIVG